MIEYFNSPPPKRKIKVNKVLESPTGVVDFDAFHCNNDFPAVPDLEGEGDFFFDQEPTQQECCGVRFSQYVDETADSDWSIDDLFDFRSDVWWTRQDIAQFRQSSREKAQEYRTSSEHTPYIKALVKFVKTCQKGRGSSSSQQEVLWLSPSGVRGLEGSLDGVFGNHHLQHSLRLLKVQRSLRKQAQEEKIDESTLERSLRLSSRQTSRSSRALAQILALGDHLQVVALSAS